MKIDCIRCDICNSIMKDFTTGKEKFGTRFKFRKKKSLYKTTKLDICDECIQKLVYISSDLQFEKDIVDELVDNAMNHYEESCCQASYLAGVEDTLNKFSKYRALVRKCNE